MVERRQHDGATAGGGTRRAVARDHRHPLRRRLELDADFWLAVVATDGVHPLDVANDRRIIFEFHRDRSQGVQWTWRGCGADFCPRCFKTFVEGEQGRVSWSAPAGGTCRLLCDPAAGDLRRSQKGLDHRELHGAWAKVGAQTPACAAEGAGGERLTQPNLTFMGHPEPIVVCPWHAPLVDGAHRRSQPMLDRVFFGPPLELAHRHSRAQRLLYVPVHDASVYRSRPDRPVLLSLHRPSA